jgi:hypothetical protein
VRLAATLPRHRRWPFGPRRSSRSLLGRGHAGFGHPAARMLVLDVSDVRWAGAVVVVAARRQGVVCRRGWSSAYVRPAGLAVGDSAAAHGLQLRVLVRCVWYSVCHGGDPMMRGRCCMGAAKSAEGATRTRPRLCWMQLSVSGRKRAAHNVTARHRHFHLLQLHPIIND